jgi:hypothetical protein
MAARQLCKVQIPCKYTRWLSRVNSREQRWLRTGKRSFAVLQAAAFFTPNGDGANDYWNLKGLNGSIYKNAKIFISIDTESCSNN